MAAVRAASMSGRATAASVAANEVGVPARRPSASSPPGEAWPYPVERAGSGMSTA